MSKHEFKTLQQLTSKCKEIKGSNSYYAETYCDGQAIINDPVFYIDDEKYMLEKDVNQKLNSQMWSYII